MKNPIEFEKRFVEKFGDIDRTTLSSITENRLRFELGGDETNSTRIKQAKDRSKQILEYCFSGAPVWLRIILWDSESEANLNAAGLNLNLCDDNFKNESEDEVLHLFAKKFGENIGEAVATSIINSEMALEPSANITCYFIDFEKSIIANIYDDRGMDVYSPNKSIIDGLSDKFSIWLV